MAARVRSFLRSRSPGPAPAGLLTCGSAQPTGRRGRTGDLVELADGVLRELEVEAGEVLLELGHGARPDDHRRHPAAAGHPGQAQRGRGCAVVRGELLHGIDNVEAGLVERVRAPLAAPVPGVGSRLHATLVLAGEEPATEGAVDEGPEAVALGGR